MRHKEEEVRREVEVEGGSKEARGKGMGEREEGEG